MTHPKPLQIGQSDFREFRRADGYYVDKSMFIEQVINAAALVMLLPRPRRFGKTLNLSMLRYFFEQTDEDNAVLFDGLAIKKTPLFNQHQGQYPVIYMTLKDLKSRSWQECFDQIREMIHQLYLQYTYLLDGDLLHDQEKSEFNKVISLDDSPRVYQNALKNLSNFLHRHHQQKVIILIDEYDTPIQSGYSNNYYDEVISFMRNFLSGGLKDNPHLFKGVLTGIFRVAKESIFSGLNNLGVYTLLSDKFSDIFGFTETDVADLLAHYNLSNYYEEVADWYNGYLCGKTVLYNPWSLLNYIDNEHQAKPYWVNTADTHLIEELGSSNF
ncbi:AAA family ATPase [Anaerolineales bacterium HSG25]|nr:AAA family ATPase [Anaerolineales bacterium HSG25]